jgi:hypothetical protein
MSRDHGPGQSASSLTVSKVAGDQSHAGAAALVLHQFKIRRVRWEGLSSSAISGRNIEGVEQGALQRTEIVVRDDP